MNLKNILLLNAISSGIAGIVLALGGPLFKNLFGLPDPLPFVFVGVFLALFALFVLFVALAENINLRLVQVIIGLDITWVLASVMVIILTASWMTVWGILITLGVAFWVALMAVLQINRSKRHHALTTGL